MAVYFSGIQPSNNLTLGNYLGAIKPWKDLVETNKDDTFIFMVADLHSLTTTSGEKLRQSIESILRMYYAFGLFDYKNVHIFRQSEVPQHAELCWILSNVTNIGHLRRMTQFKDKTDGKNEGDINAGLFYYPVLMAADILLYDVDFVPVGEDQKQHVELTRDIAEKFNYKFGECFKLPDYYSTKSCSRVMSLLDGRKKMSKSDMNDNSRINLTDSDELILKKIKSAKTDSIKEIYYDKENRPEVANLVEIFSVLSGESVDDICEKYKDAGMKVFKEGLENIVCREVFMIRNKFEGTDFGKILKLLKGGNEYARGISTNKINKVKKLVGLF